MPWTKQVMQLAVPADDPLETALTSPEFQAPLTFFESGQMEQAIESTLKTCMGVMERAQEHAKTIDADQTGTYDEVDKLRCAKTASDIAEKQVRIGRNYVALKKDFGSIAVGWYKGVAARWCSRQLAKFIHDPLVVQRIMVTMAQDLDKEAKDMAAMLKKRGGKQ
jgi:hypothetical protein